MYPSISRARALGLEGITIRILAQVDSDVYTAKEEEEWERAIELSLSLAERVSTLCEAPPDAVSLAASATSKSKMDPTVLRFESRKR